MPTSTDTPPTPPLAAGPVTVQVAPDGLVTINVNPPFDVALAQEKGFRPVTERGFGEWLRGDPPPDPDAPRAPGPVDEALDKLRGALRTLGQKVEEFAEDVTTLEVRTYVSDRLDRLDNDFFTTAEPRALTRVKLDGDTDVVAPLNEGLLDEALWRIHVETVAQAQAHREAMLRTVLELVRGVVPTIK
jgi:hypothetical protein